MAEITLADLMEKKQAMSFEAAQEEGTEELEGKLAQLTPEERREADSIKEQIDVRDSQMLMQYGAGAKQNIADFSANILNNIRARDSGAVGEMMTELVTNVEGLDFEYLEKDAGIFGIFKKAENRLKRFMAQFERLEDQVDRIEGKLDEARMGLLRDIGMFDTMYEKNLEYFKRLQIYITAGEEKIAELKGKTIPSLRAEAQKGGDPMSAQIVRDLRTRCHSLRRKCMT